MRLTEHCYVSAERQVIALGEVHQAKEGKHERYAHGAERDVGARHDAVDRRLSAAPRALYHRQQNHRDAN